MPKCAFSVCKSHRKKVSKTLVGIALFSFPRDANMKNTWINIVRQQRGASWNWTEGSRICAGHFRASLTYTNKRGYRKLFQHAIPRFEQEDDEENGLNNARHAPEPPRPLMKMYSKSQMIKLRKLKMENEALRDGNRKLAVQAKNLLTQNIQYAREKAARSAATSETGSGRKRKLE